DKSCGKKNLPGDGPPGEQHLQGGSQSMSITVNTNLASLNAKRHLDESSDSLTASLERLSSGLRINNASDDAAGLAIADKLERDVRVAAQAVRNANDGITSLAIGEKALGKVTDVLTRLSGLGPVRTGRPHLGDRQRRQHPRVPRRLREPAGHGHRRTPGRQGELRSCRKPHP